MLKILLKALILLLIVLSIYLIVHPTACSNLLAGRETVMPDDDGVIVDWRHPMAEYDRTIDPAQPRMQSIDEALQREGVNTQKEEPKEEPAATSQAKTYSQEDIDYAIARRYVELEQEYAQKGKVGKDTSREISFIVMDDFEMTAAEWDSFLSRATANDLFAKARKELATKK